MSAPENCPNCGAEVPARARSCPECGADEATGWNDRAATQRLGVPDSDDFDADEFASDEWGPPARRGPARGWVLVAVILLAALVWWLIPR